jgi:hypothetical protein
MKTSYMNRPQYEPPNHENAWGIVLQAEHTTQARSSLPCPIADDLIVQSLSTHEDLYVGAHETRINTQERRQDRTYANGMTEKMRVKQVHIS